MADTTVNLVRSVLGQGLAMGWGDEAEALLRSKLGDETYEDAVKKIRAEYGTFSQEHPVAQLGGEFVGGAIPAIASLLVPGGQAAAPTAGAAELGTLSRLYGLGKTTAQRSYGQNLARLGTTGAVQGGIAGAGAAEEDVLMPTVLGTVSGGALGTVLPVGGTILSKLGSEARDVLFPSVDRAKKWAIDKLRLATMEKSPAQIASRIRQDIQLGVPATVANVTRGTMDLAEAVVQRSGGPETRELTEAIVRQQEKVKPRVKKVIRRGLQARDFYQQDTALADELRKNANTVYDAAYSVGDINDPVLNRILQEPEFKSFFERAIKITNKKRLAAELDPQGDPSRWTMKQIYDPQTGQLVDVPDVRTLDYVKQGIDEHINELFSTGKSKEAGALKDLRIQYVNRLDSLVPEYKAARAQYAGDIEVLDALRAGREDFSKMDPEEVAAFIQTASKGEQDAFRTGVARHLFDQITGTATDRNFAKNIVRNEDTMASLGHLFQTPAQRDLFTAALEREDELFRGANRILHGSGTSKREEMREALSGRKQTMEAAAEVAKRGFFGGLLHGVEQLIRRGSIADENLAELAKLLRTGKPSEVAAIVRMLEKAALEAEPREAAIRGTQAGIVGGTIGAIPTAPASEEEEALYQKYGLR